MITLGIISVQKKKENIVNRIFKKQRIKCEFGENPHFILCDIYTNNKSIKKVIKAQKKAERFLIKQGAEKVFCVRELMDIMGVRKRTIKNPVPYNDIIDCYLWAKERTEKKISKRLNFFDKSLKAVSEKSLSKICLNVKELSIYTECIKEMNKKAEVFLGEYGMWIDVRKWSNKKEIMCDDTINADKGFVRVGDFLIDGVEYEIDTGGYDIDKAEIGNYLKDKMSLKIKNRLSGNNALKL